MIVKAVFSLLEWLFDFIMSLFPEIPVIPSFIVSGMETIANVMEQGAGIVCWLVGQTLYLAVIDFFVLIYTFKLFLVIFGLVKKYILLKGGN